MLILGESASALADLIIRNRLPSGVTPAKEPSKSNSFWGTPARIWVPVI